LNLWECQYPGCAHTAVGCGDAIGLRALGWYVREGTMLLCPEHRPDAAVVPEALPGCDGPCAYCTAEAEARRWQAFMAALLELIEAFLR
jgi:hypothetical protein